MITGGVRSGKSRYAELLLAAESAVTYLAPGPTGDSDPEWAARIAAHRLRRPAGWTTVETADLVGALQATDQPVMIDCLGTWLTATIDEMGTWAAPLPDWQDDFGLRLDQVVEAWQAYPGTAVAVTNEVGWGLVSEHRSGRVFADLLGRVNQAVAAASDEVILMVAGRALRL
jgi:adenosylcobinamide kinase/adenosylcobinamide-phosphate guanylyltransferase